MKNNNLARATNPSTDFEIVTITPATARGWLESNTNNRGLRQLHVDRLALSMVRQDWTLNGESIKFNDRGELVDGQHRLAACIQAKASFTSLVVRNLPEGARATMDTGLRRSPADWLRQQGVTNSGVIAAALTYQYRFDMGEPRNVSVRATPVEAYALLQKHERIVESVPPGAALHRQVMGPEGMYVFCHYHFASIDQVMADDFFTGVTTGEMLHRYDPRLALRSLLLRARESQKAHITPTYRLAVFIKAWNHYRDGADVKSLRWNASGKGGEGWPEAR